jgi:hypothetical protein
MPGLRVHAVVLAAALTLHSVSCFSILGPHSVALSATSHHQPGVQGRKRTMWAMQTGPGAKDHATAQMGKWLENMGTALESHRPSLVLATVCASVSFQKPC